MSAELGLARVAEARRYLGVKWRHRGRKPWALDCIGLVILALRVDPKIVIRDRMNYSRDPWEDGLREALRSHFGAPVADWSQGDIVLFADEKDVQFRPRHVGVMARANGYWTIIHSLSWTGCVEHRIDEAWQARIIEVYRP